MPEYCGQIRLKLRFTTRISMLGVWKGSNWFNKKKKKGCVSAHVEGKNRRIRPWTTSAFIKHKLKLLSFNMIAKCVEQILTWNISEPEMKKKGFLKSKDRKLVTKLRNWDKRSVYLSEQIKANYATNRQLRDYITLVLNQHLCGLISTGTV